MSFKAHAVQSEHLPLRSVEIFDDIAHFENDRPFAHALETRRDFSGLLAIIRQVDGFKGFRHAAHARTTCCLAGALGGKLGRRRSCLS